VRFDAALNRRSGTDPGREQVMPRLIRFVLLMLIAFPAVGIQSDVNGDWDLSVSTAQGDFTPSLTIRQEGERISGVYRGRMGETALAGSLKGNEIRFSVNLKFRDQDFGIQYAGTVEGNSMKGTVQFSQGASGTWSARRKS
jgi:hypothetical protein